MTRKTRLKAQARNVRKQAVQEQAQARDEQLEAPANRRLMESYFAGEDVANDQIAAEATPSPLPLNGGEPVDLLEKDYYDPYLVPMGPTSFEELDAMEEARERAHEVQEITWNVQDLVRNILFDYTTEDPGDKAAKITKVAEDYQKRVKAIVAEPIKKDIEVLQIEAMLAIEKRNTTLITRGVELIKETLSAGARKKLEDSDFALPEKKKYPIHDKAHVRNALARVAQQIEKGGEGAEDAKAALPVIRAAAKKFGIDVSMEKSAFMIEKDAKGDWRWIGKPTNNFIDWQTDIIAKSAHENYMAFLDANPDCAPAFVTWHTAGTARANPVDFWMEHEGAVIMSGKLTEEEAGALFRVQKEMDLGMSHQAFALRLDPDPRVVTHYWMYEVSDLPRDAAANPFTSLETITKEVGMDKLEYLTEMMGSKEKAQAYLEKTSQMQKGLQDAGITSKEKQEDPPAPLKGGEAEVSAPPAAIVAKETVVTLDMKAIVEQIGKEFDIEGLNVFVAQAQDNLQKIEVLEGLVKELQGSSEDKLAAALTPPAAHYAWTRDNRPSQSDATKLKKDKTAAELEEDEKLSKAAPGVPAGYWLSEVSGSVPVEAVK